METQTRVTSVIWPPAAGRRGHACLLASCSSGVTHLHGQVGEVGVPLVKVVEGGVLRVVVAVRRLCHDHSTDTRVSVPLLLLNHGPNAPSAALGLVVSLTCVAFVVRGGLGTRDAQSHITALSAHVGLRLEARRLLIAIVHVTCPRNAWKHAHDTTEHMDRKR